MWGAPRKHTPGSFPELFPGLGQAERVRWQERARVSIAAGGGWGARRDRAALVPANYTITLLCRAACKISWRLTHGRGGRKERDKKALALLPEK